MCRYLGRERDLDGMCVKEPPVDEETVGCLVLGKCESLVPSHRSSGKLKTRKYILNILAVLAGNWEIGFLGRLIEENEDI